jgi:hypothetical protein
MDETEEHLRNRLKEHWKPDELQHRDELNVEWVKAWKKRVRKGKKAS